jgi:hypothetical protein
MKEALLMAAVSEMDFELIRLQTLLGMGPKKIPHNEVFSCPDAETFITGIDYYDHPRQCRQRMRELYPYLGLRIPETDKPRKRPRFKAGESVDPEKHTVRWGDSETATFEHGEAYFKCADDVFAFSPLAKGDFTDWPHVVMNWDFSSEEAIYRRLRPNYPEEWGERAPEGTGRMITFYNTLFMWPMLTFGWELFLECSLDPRFERIMDEFAEINRRVFKAIARLPVRFVGCHDDIVMTAGPVCSPEWMRETIFPRYEEYWGILRDAGKRVIFVVDGCVDTFVDDIMACGASGFFTEPYSHFKSIAARYPGCVLSGEGDNRVLMRDDPKEIRAMVESMVETGKRCSGYMMSIGNHIPWNLPPTAVRCYLDLCNELAYR